MVGEWLVNGQRIRWLFTGLSPPGWAWRDFWIHDCHSAEYGIFVANLKAVIRIYDVFFRQNA